VTCKAEGACSGTLNVLQMLVHHVFSYFGVSSACRKAGNNDDFIAYVMFNGRCLQVSYTTFDKALFRHPLRETSSRRFVPNLLRYMCATNHFSVQNFS